MLLLRDDVRSPRHLHLELNGAPSIVDLADDFFYLSAGIGEVLPLACPAVAMVPSLLTRC